MWRNALKTVLLKFECPDRSEAEDVSGLCVRWLLFPGGEDQNLKTSLDPGWDQRRCRVQGQEIWTFNSPEGEVWTVLLDFAHVLPGNSVCWGTQE